MSQSLQMTIHQLWHTNPTVFQHQTQVQEYIILVQTPDEMYILHMECYFKYDNLHHFLTGGEQCLHMPAATKQNSYD